MADDFRTYVRSELLQHGVERPDREIGSGFRRLRRGVYTSAALEDDRDSRYRRQVVAAHRTLSGAHVFSHESAAVMLGLPILGQWPEQIHLICERRSGGRSQLDVVRHCVGLEAVDPVEVDGALVTSPARTAFDIALSRPFAHAVVLTDAAMRHPGCAAELAALAEWYGRGRGHARLARVLIREKNRENRMRRGVVGFARWDWSDLRSGRLGPILAAAGVPRAG